MTYLIAGGGPAAVHCAKAIRQRDSGGRIVMLSPEGPRPYSRITVPEYLTGEVLEEDIYFLPEDFATALRLELLSQRLVSLEPDNFTAILEDGSRLCYDKLLLATGSRPLLPPFVDTAVSGVYQMWNKADALAISSVVTGGQKAVIIGGGLVGMQAARALHSAGLQVTVVELAPRLMPLQLDQAAADMLLRAAEEAGAHVLLGVSVAEILSRDGAATGVLLTGGEMLDADLVVVSVGVRPNLSMLDGTDLPHERGVEVDAHLQTALPGVYAAGDVVVAPAYMSEEEKTNRAIWLNAVRQGSCAGANMAGEQMLYEGARSMNSIQLFGLGVASVGEIEAGNGHRELVLSPAATGRYQKLVFDEQERLAGAVLAGDIQSVGALFHKIGSPLCAGFLGSLQQPDVLYAHL